MKAYLYTQRKGKTRLAKRISFSIHEQEDSRSWILNWTFENNAIWYDMIWYDMKWYDMIWVNDNKQLNSLNSYMMDTVSTTCDGSFPTWNFALFFLTQQLEQCRPHWPAATCAALTPTSLGNPSWWSGCVCMERQIYKSKKVVKEKTSKECSDCFLSSSVWCKLVFAKLMSRDRANPLTVKEMFSPNSESLGGQFL